MGLPVLVHPRPCVSRLISDSCSSARVFASGFLKGSLRKTPLPLAILCRYLAWSWTNSLSAKEDFIVGFFILLPLLAS